MTRRTDAQSVIPLPNGESWPESISASMMDFWVDRALKYGNAAILARYLRERGGRDRRVQKIANILDPSLKASGEYLFRAHLKRRGKGRPPKSDLENQLRSALGHQKKQSYIENTARKRGAANRAHEKLAVEGKVTERTAMNRLTPKYRDRAKRKKPRIINT